MHGSIKTEWIDTNVLNGRGNEVRTGPGRVGEVVIDGAPRELLQLPAAQVKAAGGRGFFKRPVQRTVPAGRSRHS